jgi:hypothetical protein
VALGLESRRDGGLRFGACTLNDSPSRASDRWLKCDVKTRAILVSEYCNSMLDLAASFND